MLLDTINKNSDPILLHIHWRIAFAQAVIVYTRVQRFGEVPLCYTPRSTGNILSLFHSISLFRTPWRIRGFVSWMWFGREESQAVPRTRCANVCGRQADETNDGDENGWELHCLLESCKGVECGLWCEVCGVWLQCVVCGV